MPYQTGRSKNFKRVNDKPKRADFAIHKKGGDQYVSAPKWYRGKMRWANYHGFRFMSGNGRSAFFMQEIQQRIDAGRSCIFILAGPPGEGKTYSGMRLAQMIDKNFKMRDTPAPDPSSDDSQIAFAREHLLYVLGEKSPLKRGQVVIIDESQYAMGSRRWYEDVQKDLMDLFAAIRSKGIVILIIALHIDLLDVIIRKFVLSYMVYLEARGIGTVYALNTPRFATEMQKRRLGTIELMMPGHEECPSPLCLTCKALNANVFAKKCFNLRAVYERRKKEYVDGRTAGSKEKIEEKKLKDKKIPDKQILETLHKHRLELQWTKGGKIDPVSAKVILERELKVSVGRVRTFNLTRELTMVYTDVVPPT